MRILMFSPGFPVEMARFTAALGQVGAEVVGLGDGPPQALPPEVARILHGYVRVPSLWDEQAVVGAVREYHGRRPLDRAGTDAHDGKERPGADDSAGDDLRRVV